jgi:hypothetical protein
MQACYENFVLVGGMTAARTARPRAGGWGAGGAEPHVKAHVKAHVKDRCETSHDAVERLAR